ncbi:MAG: hypothetical protein JKY80_07050, partial [Mariprofundaceae bacterium]|nr:hypothetical protein [Mariprofundaceae bacterium]
DKNNRPACRRGADYILKEVYGEDQATGEVVGPKVMTDDECKAFDFRNTPSLRKELDSQEKSIVEWIKERDVFAVSNDSDANVERIRRDVRIEGAQAEVYQLNQILAYRKLQRS